MTMEVIQRDLLFSYVEESKGFVLPCSIPCLSHDRRGISEKCKTQKGVKNARISLPCLLKSIRTDKVAEPFSERHYSYDCRALHSGRVSTSKVKGNKSGKYDKKSIAAVNKSDQAVKAASKQLQDLLGEPRRRRVRPAQRSQRAQTQATEAAGERAQDQTTEGAAEGAQDQATEAAAEGAQDQAEADSPVTEAAAERTQAEAAAK